MAVTLVATTKRPRRHAHNGQRMRFVHGEISACSLFSPLSVSANPFSAYGAPYDPAAFQRLMERKVTVPVIDVFKESQWN